VLEEEAEEAERKRRRWRSREKNCKWESFVSTQYSATYRNGYKKIEQKIGPAVLNTHSWDQVSAKSGYQKHAK